ncbi:hypothetical protein N7453_005839 [Penicillium expansum]|nr:hypothetical protein N7453_005839 [Penicillium expansum]
MSLDNDPNVEVARGTDGVVCSLDHLQKPWSPPATGAVALDDAKSVADKYLVEMADEYRIPKRILSNAPTKFSDQIVLKDAPFELKFVEERSRYKSTALTYQQTLLGLPVWDAKISVTLDESKRVVNSLSSISPDASAPGKPKDDAKYLKAIDEDGLRQALGFRKGEGEISINKQRLLVYLFNKNDRQEIASEGEDPDIHGKPFAPTLILHDISDTIQHGRYYVVRETLFTLPLSGHGNLNWRAFIEVETGSILYLRALTACVSRPVNGWVFTKDPVTRLGNTAPATTGSIAELNLLREKVLLPDTTTTTPQALMGQYAEIKDVQSPYIQPPNSSTGEFNASVETDDFAAANAYHHIAKLFRLVADLGFSVETLFNRTEFPVPVDHRGFDNRANAEAPSNQAGDGSGGFIFGRSDENSQIGISADFRIAAHEFGHALLWDAISWPGFGFAHSPGDALGSIYCDPGSNAPDRFDSFPWSSIVRRRHDRDISAGWAWGGQKYKGYDPGFYLREQILSTTLFRIYQSIGGDAINDLSRQTWASKYTLYLIIGGIATITATAEMPHQYVSAMMLADNSWITIPGFPSFPGGAARKIIRWSFEKQGLYHPLNSRIPVTTRGPPPLVDVYINDGRDGEYDYISDFDDAPGVWNRQAPDGGTINQPPAVGATNYCYVTIGNRGTGVAEQIEVEAYYSTVPSARVWPADFTIMAASPAVNMPASINGKRQQTFTIGPFEWNPSADPSVRKHSILAAVSANADPSNIHPDSGLTCATGPTDVDKLVPFDNNLAMRTI